MELSIYILKEKYMKILLAFYRFLLARRYKVTIVGTEILKEKGPFLFLANHVALIDPQILLCWLSKYTKVSPVASELYYNKLGYKQVMALFGTVPVGDLSQSADPEEVKKVFGNIIKALSDGKNILIYPSGQIYRQGFEVIRGKQFAYQAISGMPENTKVIGVRTLGLWGSMWGRAWDNAQTGLTTLFLKSILIFFVNFIFFIPKRQVLIEFFDITADTKSHAKFGLNSLNSFLESFYNQRGEEDLTYIRHYFFYNDVATKTLPTLITGSLKELSLTVDFDTSKVDQSIKNDIKNKIATIKKIPVETIKDTSNFVIDLFFDSLDLAEIKSYTQTKYEKSSNPPITDLKIVSDIYAMAIGKSKSVEELKPCEWGVEGENKETLVSALESRYTPKDTILTLWKKEFSKNKTETFLWDNMMGMQTKTDFILKAYLIRNYIKKIPGEYIGIMLPSLGSTSLLIISTYLAGKTPVMLNWTLGREAFNHTVSFSNIQAILTSSNFYEKVKQDFLEEYAKQGKYIFLETLLKDIPLIAKLRAVVSSKLFILPKQSNQAVLLFTSGSESLPKPVPLTHTNLITDIIESLKLFPLKKGEKLLGFLPPFHSFGFTINTIMPLITGLQSVYTPNPNDATTILNIINHTKITAIPSTPTFLKMILAQAKPEDIASLKYAVTGAEKCSEEVFSIFERLAPNAKIIEGYGITECSPVVALNPFENPKKGTVGKILSHLKCKILDTETHQPINVGEQGIIYVSGSSIFAGYLDSGLESPFEEIEGESYYKTGDLGKLDEEGYLTITGRLKRFVKIAGEMISLPFVENILLEKYGSAETVKIALEALEKEGSAKLVLFSIQPLVLDEINAYLREKGVSTLIKIDEIQTIDSIPLLGTGKIDYKELKKRIQY